MEITTAERNQEKRMKRIEDSLRDLWDNIKCTNIPIIGVPEEEKKISPGSAECPIQDKSKEKHANTHINQTIKN